MSTAYRRYRCRFCSHVYDEALGDPDSGLAPGTRYEDIPDDWMCPECGAAKSDYVLED
jgi:rubredoxin